MTNWLVLCRMRLEDHPSCMGALRLPGRVRLPEARAKSGPIEKGVLSGNSGRLSQGAWDLVFRVCGLRALEISKIPIMDWDRVFGGLVARTQKLSSRCGSPSLKHQQVPRAGLKVRSCCITRWDSCAALRGVDPQLSTTDLSVICPLLATVGPMAKEWF